MTSVAHDQVHDETIPAWGTWHIDWDPEGDIPPSADFDAPLDADAAFDRPTEEELDWWSRESIAREYRNMGLSDEPSDADWDEYARWAEWQDRLEFAYRVDQLSGDALAAAGLAIG
jgi:hypothetical protein